MLHATPNLINAGILPLELENENDYDLIDQGDKISINGIYDSLISGVFTVKTESGKKISARCTLSERMQDILKAGGLLAYTKSRLN